MEALKTKEEAAAALKRFAHATAELGVVVGLRNQAVQVISEKHQPAITKLSTELSGIKAALEAWALENQSEFGEKRSLEFYYGTLFFRKGKRKLECMARWTWEKVLAKLQEFPVTSQWREYIRNNPEVNEQKLLAETKEGGRLPVARLKEVGLKIVRGESFNIEPKPEMVARDCDVMP